MAATNTDLLKKVAKRWVGQIGAGGVADAVTTTIPLASVTNLPTTTAVLVTLDRVSSNGVATPNLEETVIGVVSGTNLIGCVRGAEGTAQAHNAGAVAEVLITAKGYNDVLDAFLVGHTQLGAHSLTQLTDTNGNETIKTPATASAVNEVTVTNAATGTAPQISATGDDTNIDLTLKGKGSGNVKLGTALLKFPNADGTNGQALTTNASGVLSFSTISAASDGWTADSNTWTYASASTFTIAGVDVTAQFTTGTRLKFTQTTVKYAVVISSSFSTNTTVTIAINTDYTITNAAITLPYYSYQASPQGYPTWFTFAPTYSAGGSMTYTSVVTDTAKIALQGKVFFFEIGARGTTGGTANADIFVGNVPASPVAASFNVGGGAVMYDSSTKGGSWYFNSGVIIFNKYDGSVWGLGATKDVKACGFYRIA